jgi:amidase
MRSIFILFILLMNFANAFGQDTLAYVSASELAEKIRTRELSSVTLVRFYINRIASLNKPINAIVLLDSVGAMARAKAADSALAVGDYWGPLHGVPVTIKDNYKTRGLTTTAGYPPLATNIPSQDAGVVRLLRDAGAIILAKTNLSVLAMDMQCDNPVYGRTNNPWDPSRTSGGSSGGCAAALAAGLTPLSFGNDLGGSIRLPAAYCGVYGFKPTYGVIPFDGVQTDPEETVNGIRSMAVAGPLARNIADLKLALQVLTKPASGYSRTLPLPLATDTTLRIDKLRIAWSPSLANVPVAAEIQSQMAALMSALSSAGATVVEDSPDLDFPAIWQNWGSFIGMQGGYQRSNFMRWLGSLFAGPVLADVPMHQQVVQPISVEKYMRTMAYQDTVKMQIEAFLQKYDVWITPVSAVAAFAHHSPSEAFGNFSIYNEPLPVDSAELHYYMATQAYTTPFNFSESPVLAMPIGRTSAGLPVGIQVVGRRFADFELLAIGQIIADYTKLMPYEQLTINGPF